jgi:hypothetical protein
MNIYPMLKVRPSHYSAVCDTSLYSIWKTRLEKPSCIMYIGYVFLGIYEYNEDWICKSGYRWPFRFQLLLSSILIGRTRSHLG